MKQKILSLLVLLLTAASGAWAQGAFSSDPYTSTTEFNRVSVTSSMTLNINEGVIVTVNSGLTIEDGVTLTLTGGGMLSVYGESGVWGEDAFYDESTLLDEATAGGDGKPAIILNGNAKIVIDNGEIYAEGGQGGFGGADAITGNNQPDGAAGNAFSRFPTIDGATLYYNSSYEWFKYTSGDQTLYNKMKAVPATFEVTLNDDQTSAEFEMPSYDATLEYELVRDIATGVKALVNNGAECIYVTKVEDKFVPKEAITYKLTDVLDQNNQFDLVEGTDYEKVGMHILDGNTWKDVTDESDLKPGTYEIIFKGLGKYDGNVYSQEFLLSNGYELTIPAGEYATFYHNEALYVEDEDAELYTIASVTDTEAVLSSAIEVAPAETPLLVYNKSEQDKTFLLIPTAEPDLALTVADAFKGTLDAKEFSKDDMEAAVYYVCTGKAFAPVKSAGTIAANRCWLEISTAAPSNARKIVHGDATKITNTDRTDLTDGDLYDLNGRKVLNPTKKGIYIKNGKKVVIK